MQRAKYLVGKISWGNLAHLGLNIALPVAVLLLVRLELAIMAIALVLASKWRIIAVKPRHWLANFRTNSVDLIVNLSFVILLMRSYGWGANLLWTGLYIFWLIWLKPQSKEIYVGVQSLAAEFLGLMALFWLSDSINEVFVVLIAWFIGLSACRHFVSQFEEPLARAISFGWAFVVAQMVWLLNRWLIVYPVSGDIVVPQAALIITLISYILGTLYYLQQNEVLRRGITRTYVLTGSAILVVIVWLADWNVSR